MLRTVHDLPGLCTVDRALILRGHFIFYIYRKEHDMDVPHFQVSKDQKFKSARTMSCVLIIITIILIENNHRLKRKVQTTNSFVF